MTVFVSLCHLEPLSSMILYTHIRTVPMMTLDSVAIAVAKLMHWNTIVPSIATVNSSYAVSSIICVSGLGSFFFLLFVFMNNLCSLLIITLTALSFVEAFRFFMETLFHVQLCRHINSTLHTAIVDYRA